MKLSIAMIVKNEENNIERTLNPLVELGRYVELEIIIVDTGSTDRTVEIAKKYTDKVYFHAWNNDFAQMRNISIKYCTGDWILVLDADEVLYDIKELASIFNDKILSKYNSAFVKIVNFNKDIQNSIKNEIISPIVRLFKNCTVEYEGIVHEQPKFKEPVLDSNVRFIHYGYNNDDYELMEYKFKRNIKLLSNQLENNPKDIYVNFQIATTYTMHKELSKALKYIKDAYALCEGQFKNYVYVLDKYCYILYNLKEFQSLKDKSMEGIDAYSGFLDFYFYLGEACFNLKQYRKAAEAYNNYLKIHSKISLNNKVFNNTVSEATRGLKNNILFNLAMSYYNEKNYGNAISTIEKIQDINLLKDKMYGILSIIDEAGVWKKLSIVDKIIDKYNYENVLVYFQDKITVSKLKKIDLISLNELNTIIDSVLFFKENNNINEDIFNKISKIMNENKIPYIVYVYYCLKYDISKIKDFLCCYGKDKIEGILIYLSSNYYDFNDTLEKGINTFSSNSILDLLIRCAILKALLLGGKLPDKLKKETFMQYIYEKYCIIINAYDMSILEDNIWNLSEEERFVLELKNTLSFKYKDPIKYIKCMKKILNLEKNYVNFIKLIIEEDKDFIKINDDIKTLVPELINNVQALIQAQKYKEAYIIIEDGLDLIKFDFDLVLLEYNLLLKLGYEKEAENCLKTMILYGENKKAIDLIVFLREKKNET